MVRGNRLFKVGHRSRLPSGVLKVLQRNNYIDRYVEDGNGAKRVWFEKGVQIRTVRKQQLSVESLWIGKSRVSGVQLILETEHGFMTDRECRRSGTAGVVCYKVHTGLSQPTNIL